uniref:DUF2828 domain-containing protein n=1 Tax=Chromera velia CCMP2878 TaxID=1169474 RepID=A0A0G4HRH6_9ALVE|eukprot:Cvel_8124.t1-p1 / transcript=Cvel_8124.t1 / gene=Cvel_8124 / organism=Chromera_velia_CCMP2878 / gene_product=Uncharacterized protein L728, putative / transcript_product=Uncharacterized protein L728, putative / location=Cvel_scaffold442:6301-7328(+) / protein_length=241 / sequence_SO=supercontig / SO=protein_coding / is_pseudo=false
MAGRGHVRQAVLPAWMIPAGRGVPIAVVPQVPQLQLTENGALAHSSSGNACLDFFVKAVPNIGVAPLQLLLSKAWGEDPETALKLIFHLGAVRDGKQDRRNFYVCMEWLKKNHFDTFLFNLCHVPRLVCWKSLLDLLIAEVDGFEFLLDYEDPNWYARRPRRRRAQVMEHLRARRVTRRERRRERQARRQELGEEGYRKSVAERAAVGRVFVEACRERAREERHERRRERHGRSVKKQCRT